MDSCIRSLQESGILDPQDYSASESKLLEMCFLEPRHICNMSYFKTECISYSVFLDYFLVSAGEKVVASSELPPRLCKLTFGFVCNGENFTASLWAKKPNMVYILRKIFYNCSMAVLYYKVMSQDFSITTTKAQGGSSLDGKLAGTGWKGAN